MVGEGWEVSVYRRNGWKPYAKFRRNWGQRYFFGVLAIGPYALAWYWIGGMVGE